MDIDAFIFMLSSWGLILGLLGFCLTMLFRNPDAFAVLVDSERDRDQ